jgi:PKD repeat protein
MTIGAVDDCRLVTTYRPGTHGVSLTVTDSKNQTASDTVQITLKELLPLTVEAIANATQGFPGDTIRFDANTVGGPPDPYCTWDWTGAGEMLRAKSFNHQFLAPGTYNFTVTVSCSFPTSSTASDTVQITIKERPQGGGLLGEGVLDNATVAGEGFRAGIIANATQVYTGSTIKFDASIRGGAPPYSYSWSSDLGLIDQDRSITLNFFEPGTFTYILTATDSNGQTTSDSIQITVEERPGGVLLPPETGQEGQPLGGGLLPRTPPPPPSPPNDNEVISPPEGGGEEEPPTTEEEGGEEPSAPPPPDDTGEQGGESPPDEEPTIPPG